MKKEIFVIKCKAKDLMQILKECANIINYKLMGGE